MQLIDGALVFSATRPRRLPRLRAPHRSSSSRRSPGSSSGRSRTTRSWTSCSSAASSTSGATWPTSRPPAAASRASTMDESVEWAERVRRAAAETEAAIRRGDDVIYQATFFDGRWLGYADFLLRVEQPQRPRRRGATRSSTPSSRATPRRAPLLQICSYVDAAARASRAASPSGCTSPSAAAPGPVERAPRGRLHGLLPARPAPSSRTDGRRAARAYPPTRRYPEPVEHCDVCRWDELCTERRRDDDDLSLVAGIAQPPAPGAEGARRSRPAAAWPACTLPLDPAARRHAAADRSSASIDRRASRSRARTRGRTLYELIDPSRLRGRHARAQPRPARAARAAPGRPLLRHRGRPVRARRRRRLPLRRPGARPARRRAASRPSTRFWARDDDGRVTLDAEKRAFERLMDLFMDRLAARPDDPHLPLRAVRADRARPAHGPARHPRGRGRPPAARRRARRPLPRRPPGRARVGRELLDQAARAPVRLHARDRPARRGLVDRRVRGLAAASAGRPGTTTRRSDQIERYNHDDVVSTLHAARLAGRPARRAGGADRRRALPRPDAQVAEPPGRRCVPRRWLACRRSSARLVEGVPADETERTPEQHARWLLAQLLSWHRREEKSVLVALLPPDGRPDGRRARRRAGADGRPRVRGGRPGRVKQSRVHRYRFPPQEHAIRVGRRRPRSGDGQVRRARSSRSTTRRARSTSSAASAATRPTRRRWFRATSSPTEAAAEEPPAHRRRGWPSTGSTRDGPYRAARDLLLRRPPRTGQPSGASHPAAKARTRRRPPSAPRWRSTRARSPIQGPPGSGKTYTGAQMVLVALVAAGQRVGVTANSHKVIGHFLDEIAEEARKARQARPHRPEGGRGRRRRPAPPRSAYDDNGDLLAALQAGELDVVGGTAWVWSREEFAGALDVLVVDEAGQIALANAIAVSPAARSLVLLGDPQQLDQPLKGTHPPGAERSALAHLLDGAADHAGRAGPLPRPAPGGSIRTSARSRPRSSTKAGWSRRPGLERPVAGGRRRPDRNGHCASCPSRTSATRASRPRRRTSSRQLVQLAASSSESYWTDRDGERAPRHARRRPHRRRVQRAGRGDRAPAARARASAPWTSSRARRRRSRSTRWRRRLPRTRRAGWSSSTA